MNIQYLHRKELSEFIESPQFDALPDIPISKHRAYSQLNNPSLDEEDVLLIIVWEDEKVIAYMGILPDEIYDQQGNPHKIGWYSCLWTHPSARGKGLAKKLTAAAYEAWNGRIILTDFTDAARNLYLKLGIFEDFAKKQGIRLYFRSCLAVLLPPRKPAFERWKELLKLGDIFINSLIGLASFFRTVKSPNLHWTLMEQVDEETNAFIQKHHSEHAFRRDKEALNWITQNPWLLNGSPQDAMAKKYAFSSVDRSFEHYLIKLKDENGKMSGFLFLTKRNGHLKVPYFYVTREVVPKAAKLILQLAHQWKADYLTTAQPDLVQYFNIHRSGYLFKRPQTKHYMISTQMTSKFDISGLAIQDGGGDSVFT